jgi:hypothetical protein
MTRAAVALVAGLGLIAIVIVITLSGSPLVVAQTNATPANEPILEAGSGAGACQAGEALPAGTSAIRLTLVAAVGPRVSVTVQSGGRVLADGAAGSGWTSGAVTVPVKPLARSASQTRICFRLGHALETVLLGGAHTGAAVAARTIEGRTLPGRFTVEYMRSGHSSWWSSAQTVVRQMGLGRAPSGGWVALLVLVLMGAALASASWLALKELR